jgi:hypothetical protein
MFTEIKLRKQYALDGAFVEVDLVLSHTNVRIRRVSPGELLKAPIPCLEGVARKPDLRVAMRAMLPQSTAFGIGRGIFYVNVMKLKYLDRAYEQRLEVFLQIVDRPALVLTDNNTHEHASEFC